MVLCAKAGNGTHPPPIPEDDFAFAWGSKRWADEALAQPTCFIIAELAAVGLGANIFDEAALQVVLRAVQGNLRLCRNLCYASLIAACLDRQRICSVSHVNAALMQPHWRSHEALLKQQVKPERRPS